VEDDQQNQREKGKSSFFFFVCLVCLVVLSVTKDVLEGKTSAREEDRRETRQR
jgi:hypothetical protein